MRHQKVDSKHTPKNMSVLQSCQVSALQVALYFVKHKGGRGKR